MKVMIIHNEYEIMLSINGMAGIVFKDSLKKRKLKQQHQNKRRKMT